MNWRKRHMVCMPHPTLKGLQVVGFVLKKETADGFLLPSELLGLLIDDHQDHLDTIRLNHLIKFDHSVMGAGDNPEKPTVESIKFIFDALPNLSPEDRVRAAIDHDIAITATVEPSPLQALELTFKNVGDRRWWPVQQEVSDKTIDHDIATTAAVEPSPLQALELTFRQLGKACGAALKKIANGFSV